MVAWFQAKRPMLRFVLVFGALIALFYAFTFTPLFKTTMLPSYLRLNARASGAILASLGEEVVISNITIISPRFAVDIRRGCDAIEPSALFVAAVLAFPASMRAKLPGIVAGTLLLLAINLVRIVTLVYTGIYFPKAFHTMHIEVWQAAFIFLALLFWVIWAWWATRRRNRRADAFA